MDRENQILIDEMHRLQANIRVQTSVIDKLQYQLPPYKDRIEVASLQLAKMRDALDQRNQERKK